MTDRELVAYVQRHGVQALHAVLSNPVEAALDRGLDLTNWCWEQAPGALLLYQVEHQWPDGAPPPRDAMRTLGTASASPVARATDAPRILVLNTARTSAWDALVQEHAQQTGVPHTIIYTDDTTYVTP